MSMYIGCLFLQVLSHKYCALELMRMVYEELDAILAANRFELHSEYM